MPQISGLFANAREYPCTEGRLKGTLPEWLEGIFIRNGPGVFDMDNGNFTLEHFFDGFAMICKFDIRNSKVTFQQKILDTEAYKKSLIAKRNVYAEFGTRAHVDPTKSLLGKVITKLVPLELTDNTVGNSFVLEGELFTSYESCFIHNINVDSLLRKDRFDFMTTFGTMMISAHPMTDSDGVTWNIGGSMLSGCKYYVMKTPPSRNGKASDALKQTKIFATIYSSWKTCVSYFHSFSMTKNYIIFMEQPMLINCVKLAQMGIKGKSLRDAFEWTPTERNRIYLVEKSTESFFYDARAETLEDGNIRIFPPQIGDPNVVAQFMCTLWSSLTTLLLLTKFEKTSDDKIMIETILHSLISFKMNPYFCFHFGNAYETDDQIVLDMITYPSPLIFDKFNLNNLRNDIFVHDDPSQLNRFVLPIPTDLKAFPENENLVKLNGTQACAILKKDVIILTPQAIAPAGMEFPRFNSRHLTKSYRYLYATGSYDEGFHHNSICKVDLDTGDLIQYQSNRDDEFFGEPIFIPKPDKNIPEDEGIVLATVSCSDERRPDYLVILDGGSFQEIARAEFDCKFLQTLHGTFIPLDQLK